MWLSGCRPGMTRVGDCCKTCSSKWVSLPLNSARNGVSKVHFPAVDAEGLYACSVTYQMHKMLVWHMVVYINACTCRSIRCLVSSTASVACTLSMCNCPWTCTGKQTQGKAPGSGVAVTDCKHDLPLVTVGAAAARICSVIVMMCVNDAAAMDPRYQRLLAPKLQEHAHNYTLTDVSFRSDALHALFHSRMQTFI